MSPAADSFGSFGRCEPLAPSERVARAANTVVTWAIVLALALTAGLAGYSLWDSYHVLKGTDLSAYKPGEEGPGFVELLATNPDVVAWLTVDNTNIDYPVVQGQDNFEYLDKDAMGASSASGSLFLDSECDSGFAEPYEVIMGHHMRGGGMFGDLDKFLERDFFEANQTATLYLPHETLNLQIGAVLVADAYDGVLFSTPATSQERVGQVLQRVEQDAAYVREDCWGPGDQLVALSTCSSDGANARTILMCRVASRISQDNG